MKGKGLIPMALLGVGGLVLAGCVTGGVEAERAAQMSHDGLVRKADAKVADAVYVRPGADLAGYTKVMLEEPEIAFRKHWQSDYNMRNPMDRIDDKTLAEMIAFGGKLFVEEFGKELARGGIEVVQEPGDDVLLVKPSLVDLYIVAPDPNNRAGLWSKIYAESFGDMTLYLELYDSVTHQILVRALDEKRDIGDGAGSWRIPRNRTTNIADASMAFREWARMFVKGLEQARSAVGSTPQ